MRAERSHLRVLRLIRETAAGCIGPCSSRSAPSPRAYPGAIRLTIDGIGDRHRRSARAFAVLLPPKTSRLPAELHFNLASERLAAPAQHAEHVPPEVAFFTPQHRRITSPRDRHPDAAAAARRGLRGRPPRHHLAVAGTGLLYTSATHRRRAALGTAARRRRVAARAAREAVLPPRCRRRIRKPAIAEESISGIRRCGRSRRRRPRARARRTPPGAGMAKRKIGGRRDEQLLVSGRRVGGAARHLAGDISSSAAG